MCERTLWHVQKAHLCLFSASSSVSVFFLVCLHVCMTKTETKSYVVPLTCLTNSPFPHSYIYKARLQPHQTVSWGLPCLQGLLVLCNCFHCHWPNQLLLFLNRTLLVIVSSKALTKIKGHAFFSTGPSLRTPHKQMSRDYPIPVERHRLCFCL